MPHEVLNAVTMSGDNSQYGAGPKGLKAPSRIAYRPDLISH